MILAVQVEQVDVFDAQLVDVHRPLVAQFDGLIDVVQSSGLVELHDIDGFGDDLFEKVEAGAGHGRIEVLVRKRRVRVQVVEEGQPALKVDADAYKQERIIGEKRMQFIK